MTQKRQSPAATGLHQQNKPRHSTTHLGPRHRRLLQALLRGPITREQADRIARASNSPHWIMELRRHGVPVQCRRESRRDPDGVIVHPGVYWLDNSALATARKLLGG